MWLTSLLFVFFLGSGVIYAGEQNINVGFPGIFDYSAYCNTNPPEIFVVCEHEKTIESLRGYGVALTEGNSIGYRDTDGKLKLIRCSKNLKGSKKVAWVPSGFQGEIEDLQIGHYKSLATSILCSYAPDTTFHCQSDIEKLERLKAKSFFFFGPSNKVVAYNRGISENFRCNDNLAKIPMNRKAKGSIKVK